MNLPKIDQHWRVHVEHDEREAKLRDVQQRNRAVLGYVVALFVIVAAAHEIAVWIGG